MKSWKDSEGNKWNLSINVFTLKKVKADTGVDLLAIASGDKDASESLADVFKMAEVLWSLTEKQAEERGINPDQFGERLAGDAFEDAAKQLLEDLVEFFPEKKRKAFRLLLQKAEEFEDSRMDAAIKKLEDPETMKAIQAAMEA